MDLVFSDHIRSLEPGEDRPAGFDAAWNKLRGVLRRTIKRLGLWHLPPRFLGIEDAASWSDPRALDELATDGYIFAVLDRLPSLKALLEVSGTVEGAVVCNIRHFIFDRQKRQDPVGYKLYDVTRCVIEELIENQTLTVVEGDPGKVKNDTLISFPAAADPTRERPADLAEQIEGWRGELFTEMVIATRKRRQQAERDLAAAIAGLGRQAAGAFRFKNLVDHIKARGRRHWSTLQGQELGDFAFEGESRGGEAAVVPLAAPAPLYEDREAYLKLLECMAEELARCPVSAGIREQLRGLWELIKVYAADSGRERPPPQRRTARALGMARGTLRKRQRQMRPLVERCRGGRDARRETAT